MGLTNMIRSSLKDAGKAYDEGRSDGFYVVPQAALVFQWYAQTRYITDLPIGYLQGCLLVAQRALDKLPEEHRRRSARAPPR